MVRKLMAPKLEPILIRVPPEIAAELRELSKRTRVPQAEYLREAVASLVVRYREKPAPAAVAQGGAR
jgi:hypothetical protein